MKTATTRPAMKRLATAGLIAMMFAGSGAGAAQGPERHSDAALDDKSYDDKSHDGTRAAITLSHAIAGAFLAGPVGYAVGVLTGDWVSNRVINGYENQTSLEQATASLANLQSANHQLQARLTSVGHEVSELQRLAAETLQWQVLFRTGQGALAADSAERIGQLAQLLQRQPELRVRLSGYSDPRGDEPYNDALSAERVASVAELLQQQGVAAARIDAAAYGESLSSAAVDDLDSYALERRVDIELLPPADDLSLADAR